MEMGGRPHGFFSRVVAMSSTAACSVCSAPPVNRFIFQTSACLFASYLALPDTAHCIRSPEHAALLSVCFKVSWK